MISILFIISKTIGHDIFHGLSTLMLVFSRILISHSMRECKESVGN